MRMSDLYQMLGLAKDATADQIKKAYRRLAQKYHPDRETGDEEKFYQVQVAYDVLSDDDRRKEYDRSGSTKDKSKSSLSSAEQELVQLFVRLLEDQAFEGEFLQECRKTVGMAKANLTVEVESQRQQVKRLSKNRGKVSAKNQDNLFDMVLENLISGKEEMIASLQSKLKDCDEILDILCDYNEESPQEDVVQRFQRMKVNFGYKSNNPFGIFSDGA